MQRVFCHSLGITSEGKHSFEGLPPERFEVYAKRAFLLADKGDLVVVPPHRETENMSQELAVLNEVGLGPDPKNIIHGNVTAEGGLVLPNGVWREGKHRRPGRIFPFSGKTALPFVLAGKMDLAVMTPTEEKVKAVDGKDFFQSLNMECIPEGGVLRSERDILGFYAGLNGGKWITKTSQNASGMSTCLVTPEKRNKEVMLSFVEQGKLPVLQRYYLHDLSPSVNMDVDAKGRVLNVFLTGQILSGSPAGGSIHEGNVYPYKLPPAVKKYLITNSIRLARQYARNGYFGPMGVDWIVDSTFETAPKAVEVNARVTAPRYPYRVMKKLGASSFYLRNAEFSPGLSPFSIRQLLDPVWFHPEKKQGVIFFNFNQSLGKMNLISLGKNFQESQEMIDEVENLLFI